MPMNFSEAKAYIITQEPTFLRRARNINGRHSFVCPCCANGSGNSGTGITANPYSKPAHPYYKCFKCGEGGDVINLAMWHTGYGFRRAVEFLCDEYGLVLEGYEGSTERKSSAVDSRALSKSVPEPQAVSQAEYFRKAEEMLDASYLEGRGISQATQRHYHVGTDPAWVNPVVAERYNGNVPDYLKSPRCIIPTSEYSYLARDTRSDVDERTKKYAKVKFGRVQLFSKDEAFKSPVFVVTEGEIDAMSVYEATEGKVKSIGLGSAANWRILAKDIVEMDVPPSLVVLALDNDEAGEKARENLEFTLATMGIRTERLYYEGKDPNEALMADRDGFKAAVYSATYGAERELGKETDVEMER